MSVTRELACLLLAAQILWAVPASASIVALGDGGHNQRTADRLLGEIEEENEEDKLELEWLETFHRWVEVSCLKPHSISSSEPADDDALPPQPVVLDLNGSRAPPLLADSIA